MCSNRAWDENALQSNITATISDGEGTHTIPIYYVPTTGPNEYFSGPTTYTITPHKLWDYSGLYGPSKPFPVLL